MSPNKIAIRINRCEDNTYNVKVVRKRTSKGTTIEAEKSGFITCEEAREWGKLEKDIFLEKRRIKNIKTKENRKKKRAREERIWNMDFKELVDNKHIGRLMDKASDLKDEIALRYLKNGYSDDFSVNTANDLVGKNEKEIKFNASIGQLDMFMFQVYTLSTENATRMAEYGLKKIKKTKLKISENKKN